MSETTRVLSPSQQAASMAPLQALEVGSQPQRQQPSGTSSSDEKAGIPMSNEAAQAQGSPKSQNAQHGAIGQPSGSAEPRLPSSLADLVTSFESAKQKCEESDISRHCLVASFPLTEQSSFLLALRRDNDLSAIHNILEAGYPNIPQPSDAEK